MWSVDYWLDINHVSTVMIFAGMPAILLFVIFYAARSPWRITAAGRAIMQLAVSLAAIYVLAGANGLFGNDWPLRGWVRLVIYTLTSFSLWRLFLTLRRIQRGENLPPSRPPEDTRGMATEERPDPLWPGVPSSNLGDADAQR